MFKFLKIWYLKLDAPNRFNFINSQIFQIKTVQFQLKYQEPALYLYSIDLLYDKQIDIVYKKHLFSIYDEQKFVIIDPEYLISGKNILENLQFEIKILASKNVCGIINAGQTCYFNSALQIIGNTDCLTNAIYNIDIDKTNKSYEKLNELQNILNFISCYKFLETNIPAYPIKLIKAFGINPHEQQDAVEVIERLLDSIPQDHRNLFNIIEYNSQGKQENQMFIRLHVQNNNNLYQALSNYQNQYNVKYKYSDVIMFNINRQLFDQNSFQMYKLNTEFKYPKIFIPNKSNNPFQTICSSSNQKYILTSVLVHQGSANSGHYFVYTLNIDNTIKYSNTNQLLKNKWFKISDARIQEVSRRDVFSCTRAEQSIAFLVYENEELFLDITTEENYKSHEEIQEAKLTLKEMQQLLFKPLQISFITNNQLINQRSIEPKFNTPEKTITVDNDYLLQDILQENKINIENLQLISQNSHLRKLNHFDRYVKLTELFSHGQVKQNVFFLSQYPMRVFLSIFITDAEPSDSIGQKIIQLGEINISLPKEEILKTLKDKIFQYINLQFEELKFYQIKGNKLQKIDILTLQFKNFNNHQIICQADLEESESQQSCFAPLQKQIKSVPRLFHELGKQLTITFKPMSDQMLQANKQSIRMRLLTLSDINLSLYPQFLRQFPMKFIKEMPLQDIQLQVMETETAEAVMKQITALVDKMEFLEFENNKREKVYVTYGEVINKMYQKDVEINEFKCVQNQRSIVFMSNIQQNGRLLYMNEPLQFLNTQDRQTGNQRVMKNYLKLDYQEADQFQQMVPENDIKTPKFKQFKTNQIFKSNILNTQLVSQDQDQKEEKQNEILIQQKQQEYNIYYRYSLVDIQLLFHCNLVRVVLLFKFIPIIDMYAITSRNINLANTNEIFSSINQQVKMQLDDLHNQINKSWQLLFCMQTINSDKVQQLKENQQLSELRGSPMNQNYIFTANLIDSNIDINNIDFLYLKNNNNFVGYPLPYSKDLAQNQLQEYVLQQIDECNNELNKIQYSKAIKINYILHSTITPIVSDGQIQIDEQNRQFINCNEYSKIYKDNELVTKLEKKLDLSFD